MLGTQVGSVIRCLPKVCLLAPRKKDVKCDGSGCNGSCPPRSHAEAWFTVEQHPQAEGRDIDHGKFVGELSMVLQCCMEEEAAHADESNSLERDHVRDHEARRKEKKSQPGSP